MADAAVGGAPGEFGTNARAAAYGWCDGLGTADARCAQRVRFRVRADAVEQGQEQDRHGAAQGCTDRPVRRRAVGYSATDRCS